MTTERAILAGGCFWGMQQLFRRRDGVITTRVGYSGGDVSNPTYRDHGTHAEAIEVIFDSHKLRFRALLKFFFQFTIPRPGTGRVTTPARATGLPSSTPARSRSASRTKPSPKWTLPACGPERS